jgi:hypothetical protein
MDAPLTTFAAPTLVPDRDTRGVTVARTAAFNARRLPAYFTAESGVRRALRTLRPDVVVNFYDLIGGFVHLLSGFSSPPPRMATAHSYLLDHPATAEPPAGPRGRLGLTLLSRITTAGAKLPIGLSAQSGFHLHDLDDEAFLRHMAGCRAYVGTAGFESLCEAFYLGKPILAEPVKGHYEQEFNVADAQRAGVAQAGHFADLDTFWNALPVPSPERVATFRRWVAKGPEVIVSAVEEAASQARARARG